MPRASQNEGGAETEERGAETEEANEGGPETEEDRAARGNAYRTLATESDADEDEEVTQELQFAVEESLRVESIRRAAAEEPVGEWSENVDLYTGQMYYFNDITGESVWKNTSTATSYGEYMAKYPPPWRRQTAASSSTQGPTLGQTYEERRAEDCASQQCQKKTNPQKK
jgi:hypothetical protein